MKQTLHMESKVIKQLNNLPDNHFRLFAEWEDNVIKEFYTKRSPKQLAEVLGKTYRQVVSRARDLGVKRR